MFVVPKLVYEKRKPNKIARFNAVPEAYVEDRMMLQGREFRYPVLPAPLSFQTKLTEVKT
jgi:hypothetical protein